MTLQDLLQAYLVGHLTKSEVCCRVMTLLPDVDGPTLKAVFGQEPDGLAMSSRNRYLSPSERVRAAALNRALRLARRLVKAGESDANKIINKIKKLLLDETGATIEYVSCVNAADLKAVRRIRGQVLIALAVKFPSARLIDNTLVKLSDDKKISR